MKLVYIAKSPIPSRQANSIHVMKICQAFAQNGHQVYLIVPDREDHLEPDVEDIYAYYGVKPCFEIIHIPWPRTKIGGLINGYLTARMAHQISPDIIFTRDHISGFFASFGNAPVIFESHIPIHETGLLSKFFFEWLIRLPSFNRLVVITSVLEQYYSLNYPSLKEKIMVAPDAADPVSPDTEPYPYPNAGRRLQVGYVGHLYPGRGIEVIESMAKAIPRADFHVIGGTERDLIRHQQANNKPLNLFFHGFKPPADVERYRLGCDILLAPYQRVVEVSGGGNTVEWMSPLKIFEYMAAGKAIIASDLPVLHEVLKHEENCLLCPPDDPDSWIEALERLEQDELLRAQLGRNAEEEFLERYTWKKRADRVVENVKADAL